MAEDDDYRMQHRAPEADECPAHDLTQVMPADVYTHPHYYGGGSGDSEADQAFSESHRAVTKIRDKPDAKVRIFRAVPAEHVHEGFHPGSWVSMSPTYARQHGRHHEDAQRDWPVISAVVHAKHLNHDGNDLNEFGYNGPHKQEASVAFRGGYHQEVRQQADGVVRPVKRRPKGPEDPMKGYSVTHRQDRREGYHDVDVHDPKGSYAGHARFDRDGSTRWLNVDDDHAHLPIEKRMRDEFAKHATRGLDATQQKALDRLAELPDNHISGAPLHKLYAEHGIHFHDEDPYEAGEVGDDHMTKDTGASIHHKATTPLHSSQDYLWRPTLEHFIRGGASGSAERPSTWTHDDEHWINGGHHRILADRMTYRQGTRCSDRTPTMAHTATGDPGPLAFSYDEQETGGSKYPIQSTIVARHPDHGPVGKLTYFPPKRRNGQILIRNLDVPEEHRRKGFGSALMDHLQQRHPDASINHGDRTNDGKAWWSGYGQGKADKRGRTAAR